MVEHIIFWTSTSTLQHTQLTTIVNLFLHFFVYIESQFDRCLDQLFGIVLSPADDAKLMEKYGSADPKRKGMVSYRHFCEVIGAGMFQH